MTTPTPPTTPPGDVLDIITEVIWLHSPDLFLNKHGAREQAQQILDKITAAGYKIRPEAGTVTIPLDVAKDIAEWSPMYNEWGRLKRINLAVRSAIAAAAPDTGEDGADS